MMSYDLHDHGSMKPLNPSLLHNIRSSTFKSVPKRGGPFFVRNFGSDVFFFVQAPASRLFRRHVDRATFLKYPYLKFQYKLNKIAPCIGQHILRTATARLQVRNYLF